MRRRVESPVAEISSMIAAFALRECAFLDELYIVRNPTTVVARLKRRHKQFLAELLSFYCCICEEYLELNSGNVEYLFDSIIDESARRALSDPFILRPPYYEGDMPALRLKRYLRRIGVSRGVFGQIPPGPRADVAAAQTAVELRTFLYDSAIDGDVCVLEQQLVRRLRWTAEELTG